MKSKSFLATFSLFLIIGIISIIPYALAETDKIKNSNPRVVDAFGNTLTSVKVNQEVQITSDITNLQKIDQPFTFAVRIFKGGIMVSDSWITGSLAPMQTINPANAWTPTASGTYTVQISIFESIKNPVQLAQPLSIAVVVQNQTPTITVSTDRVSYADGERIVVFGKVSEYVPNVQVTIVITNPIGQRVYLEQVEVGTDKTYSTEITAGGGLWENAGTYTVTVQYGSEYTANQTTFQFGAGGDGGNDVIDTIPPLVMTPTNLLIDATSATGAKVEYSVKAIDDVDGVITPLCNPFSGSFFKIGETKVTCSAKDSAGNSASKSFTVKVISPSIIIPDWIKNVASFWCNNEIEDSSFLDAIQYLINNKVIIVPETTSGLGSGQQVPAWVKNNACWWSSGQISNSDFASGIQYLISVGIIRV